MPIVAGLAKFLPIRGSCVAWLVLCAACGDARTPGQADAGLPPASDAMPDGTVDAPIDARDPVVRVRTQTDSPIGPYDVLFYSPGNELIATVTVDHDGVASAAMPDGGTVLVMPDPVTRDLDGLRAVFGVKPGDDIKLFPPVEPPVGTTAMAITVPARDGAAVYRAGTRCGGGGSSTTTITAFVSLECQPPLAIVAHAEDAGGTVIGALRGTSSSTSSATLEGPFLDPDVVSLQITNGDREVSMSAVLFPVVDDSILNDLNQERHRPLAVDEAATLDFATAPAAIVDARRLDIFFGTSDGRGQSYQRVRAATESALTFDARTEGLPWYVSRQYDLIQRKLTLSPMADPAIDGQIARITFESDPFLDVRWTLVIPPDATEVVMPAIANSRFDPTTRPDVRILLTTSAIRASSYDGYDDLRRGVAVTSSVGSYYDVTTF